MIIQVSDFRHIPGKNDAEYIKLLKEALERQKQITSKAIAKIKELSNCSEFPNNWIPCSEYPEYDFEDVLIRWHDKRKGCEDDYILCEGYAVRKHWCCIFEDEDMSDYEPVEWVPISQRRMNHECNSKRHGDAVGVRI